MIPSNFPLDELRGMEQFKVNAFCQRFTQNYYPEYKIGHFIMAAYAAVPALLTPDLLYKLWQNFNTYTWMNEPNTIHRVAVADVLMSPLCQEVGFELYEMNQSIRLAFLKWLKAVQDDEPTLDNGTGKERETWGDREIAGWDCIAEFVQQYHTVPSNASIRWGRGYIEMQNDEILAAVDPQAFLHGAYKRLYDAAAAERENEVLENIEAMRRAQEKWKIINTEESSSAAAQLASDNAWIHVLESGVQQNNATFVDLLEKTPSLWEHFVDTKPTGSSSMPVVLTDHNAPAFGSTTERVLCILIIACPDADQINYPDLNSAELFEKTIFAVTGVNKQVKKLTGLEATRERILEEWKILLKKTRSQDDVLLYLAADAVKEDDHCLISCAGKEFMRDDELWQDTVSSAYHSITMVLQVDHAASPHWLSMVDTRHAIFAACGFDQPPAGLTVKRDGKRTCLFTHCVCAAIAASGNLKLSNRDLFANVLQYYGNPSFELSLAGSGPLANSADDNTEPHWTVKAPQLLCARAALDNFFVRGYNFIIELQTLLFNNHAIDKPMSGRKSPIMLAALEALRKKNDFSRNTSYEEYVKLLQTQIQERKRYYLLIFSDPDRNLEIGSEYDAIQREFANTTSEKPDVEFMLNPSAHEVRRRLRSNRDAYELIYYSGRDLNGAWVFDSGPEIHVSELLDLLGHQPNARVLICNTCRSDLIARYTSMLGVEHTIGFKGLISDRFAVDFGRDFFKWLLRQDTRPDIQSFYKPYSTSNERDAGFMRYFHREWDVSLPRRGPRSSTRKPNLTKDEFKAMAREELTRRGIVVKDDAQKGRWGGMAAGHGHHLSATVEKTLIRGFYKILITLNAAPDSRVRFVAFFLDHTFINEMRIHEFSDNKVALRLNSVYEAFTIGAYLDDGTTLELDLNQQEGYPPGFYYTDEDLKVRVTNLKRTQKNRKDDLVKRGWGAKSDANGKVLGVVVGGTRLRNLYEVTLSVSTTAGASEKLKGDVAFFVADTFPEEVRYARAINGVASTTFSTYEAFRAGALTQDNTMLELDLNELGNLPRDFYARGKGPSQEGEEQTKSVHDDRLETSTSQLGSENEKPTALKRSTLKKASVPKKSKPSAKRSQKTKSAPAKSTTTSKKTRASTVAKPKATIPKKKVAAKAKKAAKKSATRPAARKKK